MRKLAVYGCKRSQYYLQIYRTKTLFGIRFKVMFSAICTTKIRVTWLLQLVSSHSCCTCMRHFSTYTCFVTLLLYMYASLYFFQLTHVSSHSCCTCMRHFSTYTCFVALLLYMYASFFNLHLFRHTLAVHVCVMFCRQTSSISFVTYSIVRATCSNSFFATSCTKNCYL